jgi:hypothetical protein
MFTVPLVASLFALLSFQTEAALDSAWVLEVSTPTHLSNGKTLRATAAFKPLTTHQPLVFYPHSGDSLCQMASATREMPTDAANGWRVQLVPLRNAGGLVMQVDWERVWERGARLTNGPRGRAQVTLQPGDRIVFDYISAGERAISSNMAAEARAVTGRGCDAVGMSFEIGLAPIERREIVEASLWLVRTLPNGTEQSQRQTIRVRAGSGVEYFFDDVTMSGSPVPSEAVPSSGNPREFFYHGTVRTFGKLSAIEIVNGKVKLDLTIEQYLNGSAAGRPSLGAGPPPSGQTTGGSSTFPMTAGPDEVLSFQVPKITSDRLSLRIQVKRIR